jgi:hypothetical protein
MRPKKNEKYINEQKELQVKLFNLLPLDDQNSVTLVQLDNDIETQNAIMSLLPDIRKYFAIRNSTTLSEPQKAERPWLSIIRFILKPNYDIFPTVVNTGGICSMRYFFRAKGT